MSKNHCIRQRKTIISGLKLYSLSYELDEGTEAFVMIDWWQQWLLMDWNYHIGCHAIRFDTELRRSAPANTAIAEDLPLQFNGAKYLHGMDKERV